MIHVAGPTDLFWTVSVGMGFAVILVVIILLNLLLKSVRALDTRVDHVWNAAAAVHGLTGTVGPQLRTAEQTVVGLIKAITGPAKPAGPAAAPAAAPTRPAAGAPTRPSPTFRPTPGRRW